MAFPFVLDDSDSRLDSSEDGVADESDFENLYVPNREFRSLQCWYGKIYFMHQLAQEIMQEAKATATVTNLDLALMRRITDYPYAARLAKTRSNPSSRANGHDNSSQGNEFRDFVTIIGSLAQRQDANGKRDLDRLMMGERFQVLAKPPVLGLQEDSNDEAADVRNYQSSIPSSTAARVDSDLPRFTMALKEYGDSVGTEPVYEARQLSLQPTLFRVSVLTEGSIFEGEAGNKRQAKHLASQKACRHLGITV